MKNRKSRIYRCSWDRCKFVYLDLGSVQNCIKQHNTWHGQNLGDYKEDDDEKAKR